MPDYFRPLVSIIIPTYNRARLIQRALDSIEEQAYDNYEVLVVDDWSEDETAEVIAARGAANNRIVYARNQHTKGVSGARNTGLDLARGRYIGFLDSDDHWYPGHLTSAVALLEKRRDIALTFANRRRFDGESGVQIGIEFPSQRLFRKVEGTPIEGRWYLLERGLVELFLHHNPMPTPTVLLRARSLDGLRFDEEMVLAEDRDFLLRFCLREGIRVAFRDEAAAHVMRHGGNTSTHDFRTDIALSQAHIYMLGKILKEASVDGYVRQKARSQITFERSMIPSYLRWSGQYREALRSVVASRDAIPIRYISLELLRIAGSWCADLLGEVLPTRSPVRT